MLRNLFSRNYHAAVFVYRNGDLRFLLFINGNRTAIDIICISSQVSAIRTFKIQTLRTKYIITCHRNDFAVPCHRDIYFQPDFPPNANLPKDFLSELMPGRIVIAQSTVLCRWSRLNRNAIMMLTHTHTRNGSLVLVDEPTKYVLM